MKLTKLFMAVAGVTLSISALAMSEVKQYTPESTKLLSELQQQIRATLLAVSDNERSAGESMHDFHYSFSIPAQELTHLGLVLDLDNGNNGYEVLSVTPGSAADDLGIKSKDRVLEINGVKVASSTTESTVQLLNNLKPGDTLKLTVKSKEGKQELTSKLTGQYIPEMRLELGSDDSFVSMGAGGMGSANKTNKGCGIVSISTGPPKARDIYRASIQKVDKDHLKRDRSSYKLPVGKHTILLHEYIDMKNLTVRVRSRAKPLEIEVKSNTTYHLGAKFDRDNALKMHDGAYWYPVVWKTSQQKCSY